MGNEIKWEVIGTDVNRPLVYKDYGDRFCIKSYMDNPDTVGVYENERGPLAEALCKGTGHEVVESAKLRELEAKVKELKTVTIKNKIEELSEKQAIIQKLEKKIAELTKPKQTNRVHVPVEPEVPTTPLPQKDKVDDTLEYFQRERPDVKWNTYREWHGSDDVVIAGQTQAYSSIPHYHIVWGNKNMMMAVNGDEGLTLHVPATPSEFLAEYNKCYPKKDKVFKATTGNIDMAAAVASIDKRVLKLENDHKGYGQIER